MTEQITTLEATWLTVTEFTQVAGLTQGEVVELVDVGVLVPTGQNIDEWAFDNSSMVLARRLRRIREDLELNLDRQALVLGFRLLQRIAELESSLNQMQIQKLQV